LENVVRLVQNNDDKILFSDFWTLYPKRMARKNAERAWERIDECEYPAILLALAAWRRIWRLRDDDQYVPYPASWLNGERWHDELPPEYTRHASHAAIKPVPAERRGEMPEAVRALLAKIRGL